MESEGRLSWLVVFVSPGEYLSFSDAAEAVFRKMDHEEGLEDKITIDSAATSTVGTWELAHHGTSSQETRGSTTSLRGLVSRTLDETDDAD